MTIKYKNFNIEMFENFWREFIEMLKKLKLYLENFRQA